MVGAIKEIEMNEDIKNRPIVAALILAVPVAGFIALVAAVASQPKTSYSPPTPTPTVKLASPTPTPQHDYSAELDKKYNYSTEPAYFDDCTSDCSGHDAGYAWGERYDICDTEYSNGNSESFNEGVRQYAEDNCGSDE